MGVFTDIAKIKNKGPALASTFQLWVDGEDWTKELITAKVSYTTDIGGSGMEFEVNGSLEEYQDAPVSLWVGYGPQMVEYFKGTIQEPVDNERFLQSSATAFGPFRVMVTQVLGENETFIGKTLEWVIMECARRAQHNMGEIVIINGNTYKIEPGEQFPFDVGISDVLNTLFEKAQFVGIDQVGGKRLFMPKPKPGSNSEYITTYTPTDYISFGLDPTQETSYSKVVVYRNGETGKPVVYAERDVGTDAPANRWFVVSDFAGNNLEASAEAFRLALNLRAKEKGFSMSTQFNPDIHLYDGFKAVRVRGEEQRTYACAADKTIDVTVAPGVAHKMDITGSAYEIIKERTSFKLTDKRIIVSPGVMSRGVLRDITLEDDFILLDDAVL